MSVLLEDSIVRYISPIAARIVDTSGFFCPRRCFRCWVGCVFLESSSEVFKVRREDKLD